MTRIAIIGGTGALGEALAGRLLAAGNDVVIGSRDPAKAKACAAGLSPGLDGARATGADLVTAASAGEICVLTVPYAAHAATLEQIRDAIRSKILIDATVPLRPPKVGTVQLPAVGCAALEAAALLGPDIRVVAALQNIGAEKLASVDPIEAEVLVTGDDQEAVETARALFGDIGLRSWNAGPLSNSAAAEALTSVLIQINRRHRMVQAGVRITGKSKDEDQLQVRRVSIRAIPGLPLFLSGDDLAAIIANRLERSGERLRHHDVLVVAQKVVSKIEGRTVRLSSVDISESAAQIAAKSGKSPAIVSLIETEAQSLMRVAPGVVIARHRTGHVTANAGIDASNVGQDNGEDTVLLWPVDPDASARALRRSLEAHFGVKIAVIISDSLGRAWRFGTMGTAIGASGIAPLRDRRGETDLFGRTLQATITGVADEIAAAASLVIGEAAEGTPVAIISGATYDRDENSGVGGILRPATEDLFP